MVVLTVQRTSPLEPTLGFGVMSVLRVQERTRKSPLFSSDFNLALPVRSYCTAGRGKREKKSVFRFALPFECFIQ